MHRFSYANSWGAIGKCEHGSCFIESSLNSALISAHARCVLNTQLTRLARSSIYSMYREGHHNRTDKSSTTQSREVSEISSILLHLFSNMNCSIDRLHLSRRIIRVSGSNNGSMQRPLRRRIATPIRSQLFVRLTDTVEPVDACFQTPLSLKRARCKDGFDAADQRAWRDGSEEGAHGNT